jgi:transposase
MNEMVAGWLTVAEAATRVNRSIDTIYRWARETQLLTIVEGHVSERQLLAADAAKRTRRGRPRALAAESARELTDLQKVQASVIR